MIAKTAKKLLFPLFLNLLILSSIFRQIGLILPFTGKFVSGGKKSQPTGHFFTEISST